MARASPGPSLSVSTSAAPFRVASSSRVKSPATPSSARRGLPGVDRSTVVTAVIVICAALLTGWRVMRSPTLTGSFHKPMGAVARPAAVPILPQAAVDGGPASKPAELSPEEVQILAGPPWRHSQGAPGAYLYGWSVPELGYRLGWPSNEKSTDVIEAGRVGGVLRKLGVVAMSASGHTLAVTVDGQLYSVGRDWDNHRRRAGQLGRGGPFDRPGLVGGELANQKVVAAAAGRFHSLALTEDGKVYSWGLNSRGQLGRSTADKLDCFAPGQVAGELEGVRVVAIAAGRYYSVAVTEAGQLYTWGLNSFSGDAPWREHPEEEDHAAVETAVTLAGLPRLIGGDLQGQQIVQVACGPEHWLARTASGLVYAASTGFTASGIKAHLTTVVPKIGRDAIAGHTLPARVGLLLEGRQVVSIAAASEASFAITVEGNMFSWGTPGAILGREATAGNEWQPREVEEGLPGDHALRGRTLVEVAAAEGFALVRSDDGHVFSWGLNNFGQLGRLAAVEDRAPGAVADLGTFRVLQIAAGYQHGLALCIPKPGQEARLADGETEPLLDGSEDLPKAEDSKVATGRRLLSKGAPTSSRGGDKTAPQEYSTLERRR